MSRDNFITIDRFLAETQPDYAEGGLSAILNDLAFAARIISAETRKAGLLDVRGFAGTVNIQGEDQRKLDVFADETIIRLNAHTGRLCAMVTEEREHFVQIPNQYKKGPYILVFDPLDGSSNIDTNISIGTIFGIYRELDKGKGGTLEDCLQPGRDLVAAGYILYGTSTMFVYSAGEGVHGFTLDPAWGEFLLSHEDIKYPEKPKYFSFNHGAADRWSPGMTEYIYWLRKLKDPVLSQRYIGSMVADFHRNLIHGGVFGYPAEPTKPDGKIRLIYEAAPLAFLAEQAGGYGTNGSESLLDIVPTDIHQRVPVFIGNRELVEKAKFFMGN